MIKRMLLLLGLGMTFVSSAAMAEGLGEKSLKDTDLRGAQCSLMKKDLSTQSQGSDQSSSSGSGERRAGEAK